MKVSIVIPVYNEADRLYACLEAIAAQSVAPHEVLVVDNNSTDDTVTIAQTFSFVTLLTESRQGVVHARNRGFDAATGDIIARIDADTLLPPSWISQVQVIMRDASISAVSGSAHYYDFALTGLANSIDRYLRGYMARKLKDEKFLWGANMAMRRSAWHQVRSHVCHDARLHEDFDLAIHLQMCGHRVVYNPSLVAGVSSRRVDTNFVDFIRYTLVNPRTYAQHSMKSGRHMYPVLFFCWATYLPARLIYRSFNAETNQFSLRQLFVSSDARVDPTANVV